MDEPNQTLTWTPMVPPNWKLRARLWIGAMFFMLGGADYLLLRFSFDPFNPAPMLIALAILGALGSKLLLVCLWRRLAWARYALATLLIVSIMAFGFGVIYIVGNHLPRSKGMLKNPVAGIALQALALVPLARSRSITKQMHPMTGRD